MMLMMFHLPQKQFQSTLSARRATSSSAAESTDNLFQSTLSARRATFGNISSLSCSIEFQSTLSARRATVNLFNDFNYRTISIHALREESDISGL